MNILQSGATLFLLIAVVLITTNLIDSQIKLLNLNSDFSIVLASISFFLGFIFSLWLLVLKFLSKRINKNIDISDKS